LAFSLHFGQVSDFRWCAEVLEDGFEERPALARKLPEIWARLIVEDALTMIVTVDEKTGQRAAFGAGGIVSDSFVELMEQAATPNLAVRLMDRELEQGQQKYLLRPKEIQTLNHRKRGVNLCVVHYSEVENRYTADEYRVIRDKAVHALLATQAGYAAKRFLMEFYGEQDLAFSKAFGVDVISDYGHKTWTQPPRAERRPFLAGLSAGGIQEKWGSPIASLFSYVEPRLFFTVTQQRILVRASRGESDIQISKKLGIMKSTIREHWRAIYDKVFQATKAGTVKVAGIATGESGAGRRPRALLLQWLADHPEELRPVDQRYFERAASAKR